MISAWMSLPKVPSSESDAIELYQLGCEYAQGYLFGHPISASDARKLVGAATIAA